MPNRLGLRLGHRGGVVEDVFDDAAVDRPDDHLIHVLPEHVLDVDEADLIWAPKGGNLEVDRRPADHDAGVGEHLVELAAC